MENLVVILLGEVVIMCALGIIVVAILIKRGLFDA